MSTPADALIDVFDDAETELLNELAADTYRVVRTVNAPDGYGGTTPTLTYPETGKCLLQRGGTRGTEGDNSAVILATSDYVAQLPSATIVTEADVLEVNGTEFNVTSVKRSGNIGVFATVELEFRS